MSGNPMGLSPEALAMLVETSRQMVVREAEMKAEWDAKWQAVAAQRQAEYEAMTPQEKAVHDEAMKPKPPGSILLSRRARRPVAIVVLGSASGKIL